MRAVTNDVLRFVLDTRYEDLPEFVVHEVKRSLLDGIGATLAGLETEKGKMALHVAARLGGTPESSIIGTAMKVACTNASQVNSELMQAVDLDPVPHILPFVLPAVLAIAETVHASGKELILAIAIGEEIARRVNDSMNVLEATMGAVGKPPDVFGNSNEHMIGAALAVGKLLNLNEEQMGNDLGLAGYLCSLPIGRDWEDTMPKSIIKYSPSGWNCHAAVMAALLAEQGYSGSRDMLDNEFGFHVFYGASAWMPEKITDDLGKVWKFMQTMYKIYPCCRFLQSSLDCLIDLINEYHFKPEEIDSIKAYSLKFTAHPDQYLVKTQIDAQYSFPYAATAVVYGIKPGVDWQNMNTINDSEIQTFMKKVEILPIPRAGEEKGKDPRSWYAKVDLVANGKTFSKETLYSIGTNMEGYMLSDKVLIEKFKHNATRTLTQSKIQESIDCLFSLEQVDDVSELIDHITI